MISSNISVIRSNSQTCGMFDYIIEFTSRFTYHYEDELKQPAVEKIDEAHERIVTLLIG